MGDFFSPVSVRNSGNLSSSIFQFFPSASSYWGGKALIQTDIQNINRKGQSTSYTVISFCSNWSFQCRIQTLRQGGARSPKKMFRAFGTQFGPKIRWGGGGSGPPGPLPWIRHCFLNLSILETKNGIREAKPMKKVWNELFFGGKGSRFSRRWTPSPLHTKKERL